MRRVRVMSGLRRAGFRMGVTGACMRGAGRRMDGGRKCISHAVIRRPGTRRHGTVRMNRGDSRPAVNVRNGPRAVGMADLGGTPPISGRVVKVVAAKPVAAMAGVTRDSVRSVVRDPGTGPGNGGRLRSVDVEAQSRLPKTAVQSVLTARM